MPVPVPTIGMLPVFNIFMTFGRCSHLKFPSALLAAVTLISCGIALFDQVLMVPENRIGHTQVLGADLQTIRKGITLLVCAVFSGVELKEPLTRTDLWALPASAAGLSSAFANGRDGRRIGNGQAGPAAVADSDVQCPIRPLP
jgi:uncharacterized protein (DUF486 family)